MTTITVTLSDAQLEKARKRGLSSKRELTAFVEKVVREGLNQEAAEEPAENLPEGYDPRLKGIVSPRLFGSVKVVGDIVAPLGIQWEAES